MKEEMKLRLVLVVSVCVLAAATQSGLGAPMGTAFTYQGRMLDGNLAADGVYDMQFKLYDDPNTTVGIQIGSTIEANDVEVMDGYFIAELDFGGGAFDGDARWIQVAVRPGESSNPGDFVALSPLQELTPSPHALYAASSGDGVSIPLSLVGPVADPAAVVSGINSGTGYGVYGENTGGSYGSLGGINEGVYGFSDSDKGVYGFSGSGIGVYGQSNSGYAGYFLGNLSTTGDLSVSGKLLDSSANAGTAGQVLSSTATGTDWIDPPVSSGDITAVNAGTGLSGGGTSGDVTLNIDVPLYLISSGTTIWGSSSGGIGVYGHSNAAADVSVGVYGYSDDGKGVSGSSPNGYAGYFWGDVYVTQNVSALSYTDRTPYPKDLSTAYEAVMSMERLPDGQYATDDKEHQLDHSVLSDFIRSEDGSRDLSATVSCLNEVVKDLVKRMEAQEKVIETQEAQIRQMKAVLGTNAGFQSILREGH